MRGLRNALILLVVGLLALAPARASADDDLSRQVKELSAADQDRVAMAVRVIEKSADPAALAVLDALANDSLRIDEQGAPFAQSDSGVLTPIFKGATQPTGKLTAPTTDNSLRRELEPALAALKLGFPDRKVRLTAAEDLSKRRNDDLAPLVRKQIARESDEGVKRALQLALAQTDLHSDDPKLRLAALSAIENNPDPVFKNDVEQLAQRGAGGKWNEPDEAVRKGAAAALSSINLRLLWLGLVGNLFYGISLGSVLLLAALGLAITFGLMRVINMAHGELLMIGAYATYSVEKLFEAYLPTHTDWYVVAAVPVAFVVCAAIGMLLERTVIRYLYGRPLETLLATWGISLLLIQTVRLIFGAQNVTVANPSWLAGGIDVLPGFVLTYSRLAVMTPLGLHVRAVTQNREMAASMGIPTRRVDLWTFGIGSGVAGLGGVALSQLGNVGPELGQQYIVDSFMVVVLGGVGKLAGTLAGAFGLGILNKLLEPAAGAVLGKIIILAFIILFIQRRPQGIFALKGRAAEAM